jgi:DHA1 family bicyclomycin/chloramphenicol resistance-like MFS transporter
MAFSGPRPPILLLALATALSGVAMNIFIPSMPGMVRAFDTDIATVQLTLTLYLVGVAFGQLVYGPLSDYYGRRPLLLAGVALYTVSALVASLAQSIEVLIVARIAQSLGGCAGMVISRAIVRDVYSRDKSASVMGYITMAMTIAPAMAPVIGGFLDIWFGWRSTFWALTLYGSVLLTGIVFFLKETLHEPQPTIGIMPILRSYRVLIRYPVFLGHALGTGLATTCFFVFLAGAPHLMIEVLHRPPTDYGFWFVLVSFGYFCGNFVAGQLSARLGIERMVAFGAAFLLIGAAMMILDALFLPLTPAGIFVPATFIAIGNGISQPNGIAGAISVDPSRAGAASGIVGFLQMALGAVGTVIVGHALADALLPVSLVLGAAALGSALTYGLAIVYRARAQAR